MPTGYTSKLMDKGQTFPEFTMTCARAFGALIELRDDPMDAPIPEKFEPSDYTVKAIAEASAELARFNAMTPEQRIAFGESEKESRVKLLQEMLEKERTETKRLTDMREQVTAWTPPTSEHQGLKDFMLQQIDVSMGHADHYEKEVVGARKQSPMSFYAKAVASAQWRLENNTESQTKEAARAKDRTDWVKQLRDSLKQSTH